MKIKFFTNISHELRTPLTLIKGPIQELREHETLSPKGVQYVELMEKNTNQMLQLVNQILDFRKIQNGKMRLHVSLIDFNELVVSFQKEFRVLSEENEVSFTFQLPDAAIMIWADKEKLSIVIRNHHIQCLQVYPFRWQHPCSCRTDRRWGTLFPESGR